MQSQLTNTQILDTFYAFYRKIFENHPQRVDLMMKLEENMKQLELETMKEDATFTNNNLPITNSKPTAASSVSKMCQKPSDESIQKYKNFFDQEILEGNPQESDNESLLKWKNQAIRVRKLPSHLQSLGVAIGVSFIDGYINQEFLTFHDKIYQFVEGFIKQYEGNAQKKRDLLLMGGNLKNKPPGGTSINTVQFTRDELIQAFIELFDEFKYQNDDIAFLEDSLISEVNSTKKFSPIKKTQLKVNESIDFSSLQKISNVFHINLNIKVFDKGNIQEHKIQAQNQKKNPIFHLAIDKKIYSQQFHLLESSNDLLQVNEAQNPQKSKLNTLHHSNSLNTKRRGSLNNLMERQISKPEIHKQLSSQIPHEPNKDLTQNTSTLNSQVPQKVLKNQPQQPNEVNEYYLKFKKDLQDILEDVNKKKAIIAANIKTEESDSQKENISIIKNKDLKQATNVPIDDKLSKESLALKVNTSIPNNMNSLPSNPFSSLGASSKFEFHSKINIY